MKSKARDTITHQVMKPLVIYQVVLIVMMLAAVSFLILDRSIRENVDATKEIAHYSAFNFMEYKCIGRIVNYMHDHYNEMELVYDHDAAALKEKELISHLPEYTTVKMVTPEQFDAMSEADRLLYAEVCYSEMSWELDTMKSAYNILYLSAFIYNDGELFFVATGKDDDEARVSEGGDIYDLGYIQHGSKGNLRSLDRIAKSEDVKYAEKITYDISANGKIVNTYFPVYDENGKLCLIVGVYDKWDHLIAASLKFALLIFLIAFAVISVQFISTARILFSVVVHPIKKEQDTLNEYIRDRDPDKVREQLSGIRSDNEIQTLAENFSNMASELDKYTNELISVTAEKERIGTELDMARNIQLGQLPGVFPPFPDRTEFDIYASMTPAKEVGGDFYDFFLIDDDHLALVIADVSGKGIPAALFMMRSKTIMKLLAKPGISPSEILFETNSSVTENNDEFMFVTVWLGILEISTGILTYADAGHEKLAIYSGGRWELPDKKFNGAALGILEPWELERLPAKDRYTDQSIKLSPGDMIFQYTDGVTEAADSNKKLFGEKRLLDALNDSAREPEALLGHIHDNVNGFADGTPQFDDITMLALRYNG
ncbi:MAG: serine/threonine-protein phosphatase [Oscillospiraceae bacterium]|nr:serine/threonine-protein phosphatase [Oscillospiraceae bacterium]